VPPPTTTATTTASFTHAYTLARSHMRAGGHARSHVHTHARTPDRTPDHTSLISRHTLNASLSTTKLTPPPPPPPHAVTNCGKHEHEQRVVKIARCVHHRDDTAPIRPDDGAHWRKGWSSFRFVSLESLTLSLVQIARFLSHFVPPSPFLVCTLFVPNFACQLPSVNHAHAKRAHLCEAVVVCHCT
jgi:hypothetical protein